VYVGEYHDRVSHHNVQLQVLQGLHRKDPKIAVGMEMFQRPFQKALDDYIAGSIDEREFLKRSEYFKRWGFDYNLYKPIIDFCREQKIPVVALNISREIVEKVAQKGLDALSEEEKKEIPLHMDFSDDEYKERLKDIFGRHGSGGEKKFDFFYQAQVLWDEIMSQFIDEFLKKNPDRRMVGITGGGHLAYGSGIPKRTFRRNGYEYAIILNDADVEQDIADYIVFPKPLDGVTAPKLNVLFTEKDGKISIADFSDESISKKAGLKVGDVLLSLDGANMKSVEEVKLALFFKKKNDTLKVKVMRRRFFLGDTEKEFEIKLP
jgi:aminopeptidase N